MSFIAFPTPQKCDLSSDPFKVLAIRGRAMCPSYCLLVFLIKAPTTDISKQMGQIGHWLTASAVLHADIALGTHMEPSLKAILEGHRRHIELISQALKAEISLFLHGANVKGYK